MMIEAEAVLQGYQEMVMNSTTHHEGYCGRCGKKVLWNIQVVFSLAKWGVVMHPRCLEDAVKEGREDPEQWSAEW